ncbi:MAG: gamma-glutamylcyclotransferase, partial [Rhodospirillales bacterium]
MTNRLFFYGTLMDDDVRKAIVGRPVDVAAASLQGYRRVPVAGRTYPMLVPCQGQCIEGLLADGIDARELKRLIRYEGPEYRIHTLMVQDQPALARDRLTPSHESDTELNVNRSLKQ